MAEHKDLPGVGAVGAGCFKEAVCINANRIYDSCSELQLALYILSKPYEIFHRAFIICNTYFQILPTILKIHDS